MSVIGRLKEDPGSFFRSWFKIYSLSTSECVRIVTSTFKPTLHLNKHLISSHHCTLGQVPFAVGNFLECQGSRSNLPHQCQPPHGMFRPHHSAAGSSTQHVPLAICFLFLTCSPSITHFPFFAMLEARQRRVVVVYHLIPRKGPCSSSRVLL